MIFGLKGVIIIAICGALLIGWAGAMTAKELSGLNFTDVLNGTDELLDVSGASQTSSISAFLSGDNAKDGAPFGNKKPLRLGSLAENALIYPILPSPEVQVSHYLATMNESVYWRE